MINISKRKENKLASKIRNVFSFILGGSVFSKYNFYIISIIREEGHIHFLNTVKNYWDRGRSLLRDNWVTAVE